MGLGSLICVGVAIAIIIGFFYLAKKDRDKQRRDGDNL